MEQELEYRNQKYKTKQHTKENNIAIPVTAAVLRLISETRPHAEALAGLVLTM